MAQDIFDSISVELKRISTETPLFRRGLSEQKKWAYSVCGTPIQRGKGLIVGINWGGGSDTSKHSYEPQEKMPTIEEYREQFKKGHYQFLKRSATYISKYLDTDVSQGEFNYTNICFFRSPEAKDLTTKDYEASLPIFRTFVQSISPPWILSLAISNYKYLANDLQSLVRVKGVEGKNHIGYTGKLLGAHFFCVPHPNARIRSEARHAIWQNVFETT